MDQLVNSSSQLDKIHHGVGSLGLRHGDRATIRVRGLKVQPRHGDLRRTAFFCFTSYDLIERTGEGDGGELPSEVVVENLGEMPDGENQEIICEVSSNGVINLTRIFPPGKGERSLRSSLELVGMVGSEGEE